MIKINQKDQCSGCEACSNACPSDAITMQQDNQGFYYPDVDVSKCIECGKCIKVCPYKNGQVNGSVDNKIAYACFNKNQKIRMQSTSGGMFTVFAEYILEKNGIVYGAGFDENLTVIHMSVDSKEELGQLRGSKYTQSKIQYTFREVKEHLIKDKWVLFAGTPCQISGLHAYLGKEYKKLLTIDLICMGIGSPGMWEKYLQEYENRDEIQSIFFKDKKYGWHNYRVKIQYPDKANFYTRTEHVYMNGYLNKLYIRPSCYKCPFKGDNRKSDLTIADCWGIEKICPEMDDNRGTSLLIPHTLKGRQIFDDIQEKIIFKSIPLEQALAGNKFALVTPTENPLSHYFYQKVQQSTYRKAMSQYAYNPLYKLGLKWFLRFRKGKK